jgi:hypothetical protein
MVTQRIITGVFVKVEKVVFFSFLLFLVPRGADDDVNFEFVLASVTIFSNGFIHALLQIESGRTTFLKASKEHTNNSEERQHHQHTSAGFKNSILLFGEVGLAHE